jgi:hypothetical protein
LADDFQRSVKQKKKREMISSEVELNLYDDIQQHDIEDQLALYTVYVGINSKDEFPWVTRHFQIIAASSFPNIRFQLNKEGMKAPALKIEAKGDDLVNRDLNIARFIARSNPSLAQYYSDADPFVASLIDEWLEMYSLTTFSDEASSKLMITLENHLRHHVFLVGDSITLADIAIYIAVKNFDLNQYENVSNWWNLVVSLFPHISESDLDIPILSLHPLTNTPTVIVAHSNPIDNSPTEQISDFPSSLPFAANLEFWKLLAIGGTIAVFMGFASAGFSNFTKEIPKQWNSCNYSQDYHCGEYYSGEKYWIFIAALTGFIVGLIRWTISYPDNLPGLFQEIITFQVDDRWAVASFFLSALSIAGGASLGPEQALVRFVFSIQLLLEIF